MLISPIQTALLIQEECYVVFGKSGGFGANFNLSSLNGTNGFAIAGINKDDYSGISVSGAGDVNGDGIDDVIIGSRNTGETYVLFGSSNVFPTRINLANLEANQGFILKGSNAEDLAGNSVSSAGDVNGDGIDDLIVGAPQANPNSVRDAGESYVIFGQDQRSLTIADFTRGPGQFVNSSGVAKKILIQLNNGEGVTKIDFTISYNPQLLDITGLSLDSNLSTDDWTVSVSKDITGQLKVNLTGDALAKGVANLAYLNAKVLNSATYGATNAIELESIELNGGSFNVVGDRVTHLVAYLGDANGNRKYTSADVVAISRLAAGLDSSLSAYSGIDPLLVADINGDGTISALDAALVANVVNGSTNSFIPSLP
ncbi:putative outer membrane adhesin like protein [Stanieria sp. NIES-3757]|nr:putative outer membrane adhesin like protein [Stanieria sp. NIES-3757]